MGWNGSGTFSRTNGVNTGTQVWQDDRDDGTKIRADRHDTHDQDLSDGVNACLAKNGENSATADLDIGGNQIGNLGQGTAADDAANVEQIQDAKNTYAADTGSANTYQIAISPAINSYANGQTFTFIAGNTNTGASTLNVNSVGAEPITIGGAALIAGSITAGEIVQVVYNSVSNRWELATAASGAIPEITAGDGSAADPSISFASDQDTGLFSAGADEIGFSTGGTSRMTVGSGVHISNSVTASPDRLLIIEGPGTDGTNGPNAEFRLSSDANPCMQLLNRTHDFVSIGLDGYLEAAGVNWKSSDAGSNYQLIKQSDEFAIRYASGVAAGSNITWSEALKFTTSGAATFGGTIDADALHLSIATAATPNRLLVLEGPASDTEDGPNAEFRLSADSNPVIQVLARDHDNAAISFDAALNAAGTNWVSSDAGSNFQIYKQSDSLDFRYESGIVAGNNMTWATSFSIASDGTVQFDTTIDAEGIHLSNAVNAAPDRLLVLEGPALDTADGPTAEFKISSDSDPVFQILGRDHDNVAISFDAYLNAAGSAWVSSDVGSNFQIYKQSDNLLARYESGVSKGGNIAWANGWQLSSGGSFSTREHLPFVDDTYDIGSLSFRWDDVYATNGTIKTSDLRAKTNIRPCDFGLDFVDQLSPIVYKLFGRVRDHYGFGAQDIEALIVNMGRSTSEFAGFIKSDVLDEDGQPTGEQRYGLRYDEFIAPIVKAVQELSAANKALEARVAALEAAATPAPSVG